MTGDGRAPSPGDAAGIVAMIVIMGSSFPVYAFALPYAGPFWSAWIRAVLAMATALVLYPLLGRSPFHYPRREQWISFGLGATAMAAYLLLSADALVRLPPGITTVYANTIPIWVLLALWSIGQSASRRKVLGATLGFLGVVLVALGGPGLSFGSVQGTVEILAAAATWAVLTVVSRFNARPSDLMGLSFFQFAGASIVLLPVAVLLAPAQGGLASAAPWPSLLYVGIVVTGGGFALWYFMLGRIPTATLSNYLFLVPVVALALSYFWFGESVSVLEAGGIAVIFLATFLINREGRTAVVGPREPLPVPAMVRGDER